jgi:hypothetical protein
MNLQSTQTTLPAVTYVHGKRRLPAIVMAASSRNSFATDRRNSASYRDSSAFNKGNSVSFQDILSATRIVLTVTVTALLDT